MRFPFILILLLMIFYGFLAEPVYCQDSTVTSTVQLLDNIRSDIKGGVVSVVDYLKEVSPMVYNATKQKIIVEGWIAVFTCIHLPIFIILWILSVWYRWPEDTSFGMGVATVISMIVSVCVLINYLPQIFAPDYYTIERLITFIR